MERAWIEGAAAREDLENPEAHKPKESHNVLEEDEEERQQHKDGPKAVDVEATDLTPTKPPIYDLFGVVNHFGSMTFGHYTAFTDPAAFQRDFKGTAADPDPREFVNFDDDRLSEVPAEDVVSADAYVLFYKRRGCGN